jgi:hypothetical protein
MRYFKIIPHGIYTIAKEIEAYAITKGYCPSFDDKGNSHPGGDCNRALQRIQRDAGLSLRYGIRPEDAITMEVEASVENQQFAQMLMNNGIITGSTTKNGAKLDLYSPKAVEAILGVFLKNTNYHHVVDEDDIFFGEFTLDLVSKNLEKKKKQKKTALFDIQRKL